MTLCENYCHIVIPKLLYIFDAIKQSYVYREVDHGESVSHQIGLLKKQLIYFTSQRNFIGPVPAEHLAAEITLNRKWSFGPKVHPSIF